VLYLTNIDESMFSENILKSQENFGQYGDIQKVTLSKTHPKKGNGFFEEPSLAAYITYESIFSACFAFLALNYGNLNNDSNNFNVNMSEKNIKNICKNHNNCHSNNTFQSLQNVPNVQNLNFPTLKSLTPKVSFATTKYCRFF